MANNEKPLSYTEIKEKYKLLKAELEEKFEKGELTEEEKTKKLEELKQNQNAELLEEAERGTREYEKQIAIDEQKIRHERIQGIIKLLQKSPGYLENIKALLDYRALRIQQGYFSNKAVESKNSAILLDGGVESYTELINELDRKRRAMHNKALINFYGIIKAQERLGLEVSYHGELMCPGNLSTFSEGMVEYINSIPNPKKKDDAIKYGDPNIRQKMTDGFLKILAEIEDMNISRLNIDIEQYTRGVEASKEVQRIAEKQTRDYEGRIEEDEGKFLTEDELSANRKKERERRKLAESEDILP